MRFEAAIDTAFYGVRYSQGQIVDTTGWARKQLLQFLDKGLISPADLNGAAVNEIRLADLADVDDGDVTDGQTLVRINGVWVAAQPPDAGSNAYADQILYDHIHSTSPHPVYDEIPSLTLLFENGLV